MRGVARAKHTIRSARELWAIARHVRQEHRKPLRVQAAEIVDLRRTRLTASEYYDYCLFDDNRFTREQKREYTGRRFQWRAYKAVNDPGLIAPSGIGGSWNGMIDKELFAVLTRAWAIPSPKVLAVYDPAASAHAGIETLRSLAELEALVRRRAVEGCFAKPARAASGDGACSIVAVDGEEAILGDGTRLPLPELARKLAERRRVIVQELLRPHPALREVIGPTLGTVRVAVLRRADRSVIHRAVFRIPAGTNMVDNFAKGSSGNLLGVVDVLSGHVDRVCGGTGPGQLSFDTHPDSGGQLVGLRLPDWPEALAVVEHASRFLAAMPMQSWDLALTDRGPVMIEVNDVSSQDVLQLCGPPGMLDRQLCAFLRELGFAWPYPHPTT